MKGELGNWKFKVPDAAAGFEIRDDLVFMDYAEGQTLDRMPENSKLRKWAGKTAAKGALRGLWKYGWFDADRHAGNWIVDPETQTIHLIDLGEGEVFSKTPGNLEADEVYNLAQFLINVKAKNISEIVRFGVALSKNAQPAAAQRKNLEKRIAATFQKGLSSQDEALELVTDFAESGIKLKRKVSFGALKGLTVIRQENYLPGRSFEASMLKEMAGAMLRKGPLFLRDAARGCLGGVVGVLLRRR
jgi:predicted unusual protein kinase regulating ubiquinone biosynthesis (AarF/ABC1/UbiB family)